MKKHISRLLAILLMLALAFACVSCGGKGDAPASPEGPVPEGPGQEEPPAETGAVPLLWRATDGEGRTLYLFGTIHVGDERNEAVLERLAPVLENCDALAVEFDTEAYAGNMVQMMLDMQQYVLTDGSTIEDHLPEELYEKAVALLKQARMTPAAFSRYNVAWWLQLVQSAMMEAYADLSAEKAMDSLLIHYAYDSDMPVLEVESAQLQMTLLNGFDKELYLLLLESALETTESFNSELNELYETWLSGDREALWTYLAEENEDDGEYPEEQMALLREYNHRLLDERNLGMAEKALDYLAGGQTVFFAVGAAHMADETGLVRLLTDAGCTVEAVTY